MMEAISKVCRLPILAFVWSVVGFGAIFAVLQHPDAVLALLTTRLPAAPAFTAADVCPTARDYINQHVPSYDRITSCRNVTIKQINANPDIWYIESVPRTWNAFVGSNGHVMWTLQSADGREFVDPAFRVYVREHHLQ